MEVVLGGMVGWIGPVAGRGACEISGHTTWKRKPELNKYSVGDTHDLPTTHPPTHQKSSKMAKDKSAVAKVDKKKEKKVAATPVKVSRCVGAGCPVDVSLVSLRSR